MEEKRKHIRHPAKNFAEFVVKRNRYCGTILNLGSGSAYIQAQGVFSVGDTVTIIYESGVSSTGGVKRTGTIRRVTKKGIGIEFKRPGYSD